MAKKAKKDEAEGGKGMKSKLMPVAVILVAAAGYKFVLAPKPAATTAATASGASGVSAAAQAPEEGSVVALPELVLNLAGIAQSQSLAYWHPSADITDDFVAEYNKANPVAGAPATQPTAPVRPATKPPGNR